ncbi:MAG: hypothetical protein K2W94_06140 [Alphaproteobacteria bacterium]|nr:hypothetical protein [Alphaproteobacteria bacterium]
MYSKDFLLDPNITLHPSIIEKTLQAFEVDQAKAYAKHIQDTSFTKRETYNFGYDYFNLVKGDDIFTKIPSYLMDLCKASIDAFISLYELGKAEDYQNVIISVYRKDYQLESHVDVDFSDRITDGQYVDFCFGEMVIVVVLTPDSKGKFYITKSDTKDGQQDINDAFRVDEKAGTAFLLTGPLRRKPYYHGVSCVENLRISATFRTVQFFK